MNIAARFASVRKAAAATVAVLSSIQIFSGTPTGPRAIAATAAFAAATFGVTWLVRNDY